MGISSEDIAKILEEAKFAYDSKEYQKAFELYCELEDENIPEVLNKLGNIYYYGYAVDKDLEKAVEYYTKAADQGDARAQCNLGICYKFGKGVEKDLKKAVEYYQKAAEQGYAGAQNRLGLCYEFGQGIEKDLKKAVEYYQKAANQGYADAQNNLGLCYEYGKGVEKDLKKAVEYYQKAADQNYAIAQCNLGFCYESGQGIEKDLKKAVEYYKKAADQGDARAQCNLAWCYEQGKGVEKDLKKAVEYYQKAADQNFATSQCNLGFCYSHGKGVEKDLKKAVEYYQKAADQGYARAQNNLGLCYEYGKGVEKDLKKAVEYYQKAAEQNYATAQNNLGVCYEDGRGVEKDLKKAVEYYQKAAEQNDATAYYHLARLFESGNEAVEQDLAKSFDLYSKAVELFSNDQNDNRSLYRLAICYKNGKGVKPDLDLAYKYFTAAAERGNMFSYFSLGEIFEKGNTAVEKNLKKAFKNYLISAELGYLDGKMKTAEFYRTAKGTKRDPAKAAKWYESAGEYGDLEGQFLTGECYLYGFGVESNFETAFYWYKKAADKGHKRAMLKVSNCYYNGIGTVKNNYLAYEYCEKNDPGSHKTKLFAAILRLTEKIMTISIGEAEEIINNAGKDEYFSKNLSIYPSALFELGNKYLNGYGGLSEETVKACLEEMKYAAEQGDESAKEFIANKRLIKKLKSESINPDFEKAIDFYSIAGDKYYAPAQLAMGVIYYNGLNGEKPDYIAALNYFKEALKNGSPEAEWFISRIKDEFEKVKYESNYDVFISWNHHNRKLMRKIQDRLSFDIVKPRKKKNRSKTAEKYSGALSVWQSDQKCTGEISAACCAAINSSNAWVILITKQAMNSTFIPHEIDWIMLNVKNNPALESCVIPVYEKSDTYTKLLKFVKNHPTSSFNKIINFGGIFGLKGSRSYDEIYERINQGLLIRKLSDYKEKLLHSCRSFSVFVANSIAYNLLDGRKLSYLSKFDDENSFYIERTFYEDASCKLTPYKKDSLYKSVDENKITVLLGEGGAGKSIFLSRYIFDNYSNNKYIFKIDAKAFANYAVNSDTTLFDYLLENEINRLLNYKLEANLFLGLWNNKECKIVVIIDAIDEIGNNTNALKALFNKTVNDMELSAMGNIHFLITSRSDNDIKDIKDSSKVFYLGKLSVEESKELVRKFVLNINDELTRNEKIYGVSTNTNEPDFNDFFDSDQSDIESDFSNSTDSGKGRINAEDECKKNENIQRTPPLLEAVDLAVNKLPVDIISNPLLITNFVILFINYLLNGKEPPKNRCEIAQRSFDLVARDIENGKSFPYNFNTELRGCFIKVLFYLAFKRAIGSKHETRRIFCDFFKNYTSIPETQFDSESEKLEIYLRARNIIGGSDINSNVSKTFFSNYLAACQFYNIFFENKDNGIEETIIFKRANNEEAQGKTMLKEINAKYFSKGGNPWDDIVSFIVAILDKEIYASAKSDTETKDMLEVLKAFLDVICKNTGETFKSMIHNGEFYYNDFIKEFYCDCT